MQVMWMSPEMADDLETIYQIDRRFLEEEFHRRYNEHLAAIVVYAHPRLGVSPCTEGTCKDNHRGGVNVKITAKLDSSPPYALEFVLPKKEE